MIELENDRYARITSVEPVSDTYKQTLVFHGVDYCVSVRPNGVALVVGSVGGLVFITCGLPAGRAFGGTESARAFDRDLVARIDALIVEGRAALQQPILP